jgi:hypothetical protein
MKAVKLILIFVVILAAVVGALWLIPGGNDTDDSSEDKDQIVQEQEDNLESKFKDADQWNVALYNNVLSSLTYYKKELGSGYSSLKYRLNKSSLDRIYDEMLAEFSKANCSRMEIERYHSGLKMVTTDDNSLANEDEAKLLNATYSLYKTALGVANNIGLSVGFNKAAKSWNNFQAYKQKKLAEKSAVKNSPYFKYISNVNDVNAALNSLDGKLDAARNAFKSSLAQAIIHAYSGGEKSKSEFFALGQTRDKYKSEFGDNEALKSFVISYYRELQNQESPSAL